MFSNQLLKIYSIRIVSIFAAILSYTIVIPRISGNVAAYGIYSVVLSLMLLLQYADLGFLGAGQKYAAEKYAKDDRKGEINILSFVHFILFLVVIIYAGFLVYVYIFPEVVFNKLGKADTELAKQLILIFIFSSPIIILQRFVSAVFAIRIQDYIYQMVDISASVVKIISTFYFFRDTQYGLAGYILFTQIINLTAVSISIVIIRFRYLYDFVEVLKSFRFNREIFNLTRKMAMTSIVVTIAWILYYELDAVYVSKIYNVRTAAVFAIGTTILTFSRSLMNTFLSPFQTKFNHLRGLNDEVALDRLFMKLIEWAAPISILPPLCIVILMEPLIISWIGENYKESILISQILITNLFFSFLSVPINYLAMAREKFRFLLVSSITLPFFYFLFYLIFNRYFSVYALPLAKVSTIFLNLLMNMYMIRKVINISLLKLLGSIFMQMLIPIGLLVGTVFLLQPLWNITEGKSISHFLVVVSSGCICILLSTMTFYIINSNTRNFILSKIPKYILRLTSS